MRRSALALAVVLAACGGPAGSPDAHPPDADASDLLTRLRAVPGVVSVDEQGTAAAPGYRYFLIGFDQPVDHDAPSGPHFTQQLTLIAKDLGAPMVLMNTGYWNYALDNPFELTQLLHGNQLVMEHRYFGQSRPSPADWTQLTIAQAAADQHAIVVAFKPIFTGAWVTTGQSKGGMTSIYHRRFYPDDVAGTVAYVAPISFAAPDYRYDGWVEDTLGTQACRDAVKAVATEMLTHRRAAFEQRATQEAQASGYTYTRVAIGPAVEGAVVDLYWSFWQYYGVDYCPSVPASPVTASDDTLWAMLEGGGVWGYGVDPVYESDDTYLAAFEAYDYQAGWQLGFPGTHDTYLTGLELYGMSDYAGADPVGVAPPVYDGDVAMNDVATWVAGQANHVLWVYGGWDPWTGGQFDITGAQDAAKLIVPDATHGALITQLQPPDRATAFTMLQAWTGVTPDPGAVTARLRRAPAPAVRIPPAVRRLHQLRAALR